MLANRQCWGECKLNQKSRYFLISHRAQDPHQPSSQASKRREQARPPQAEAGQYERPNETFNEWMNLFSSRHEASRRKLTLQALVNTLPSFTTRKDRLPDKKRVSNDSITRSREEVQD